MAAPDDDRDDLQREIESSRNQLTSTLAALEHKLSVGRITRDVVGTMRNALGPADGSADMFDIIRRNPVPAALIGVGVGWLLFGSPPARRAPATPTGAPQPDPKDAGLAAPVRAAAARYSAQARTLTGTAQQRAEAMVRDNPVIIGTLGLAVGALLGSLLPMTRRETELLGGLQAQIVGQVEALGRDALERARAVAEHAGRAAVDAVACDLGVTAGATNGHAKH